MRKIKKDYFYMTSYGEKFPTKDECVFAERRFEYDKNKELRYEHYNKIKIIKIKHIINKKTCGSVELFLPHTREELHVLKEENFFSLDDANVNEWVGIFYDIVDDSFQSVMTGKKLLDAIKKIKREEEIYWNRRIKKIQRQVDDMVETVENYAVKNTEVVKYGKQ
jgi:hypothetical protein